MANTPKPGDPKAGRSGADTPGTQQATQGGTRGAANATGRHSKEADHSPGSPAELAKTKRTDKPG